MLDKVNGHLITWGIRAIPQKRTRAVVGTAQPLGSVLHEALNYEDYLDALTISNNNNNKKYR